MNDKHINDGGPAFPLPVEDQQCRSRFESSYGGMSLRDYFAAKALPEVLAQAVDLEQFRRVAAYAKYWADEKGNDEVGAAADRLLALLAAQQPAAPVLAKHQPCGCVICTCEDEQQCQGCGAKHCGNRADHPPYVGQQPAAPSGEAVLGALKDVCAMHLLMLAADDREGATQMVGDHNMRAAAWRLRSDCVLPQEQAKDKIMEKLSSALALAFGDWGLE